MFWVLTTFDLARKFFASSVRLWDCCVVCCGNTSSFERHSKEKPISMTKFRYRSSDGHINGARGAVLLVSSLKLVKNFHTPPPGAPPPSPWPSPPLTTRAWWSLTSRLVKNFHTPPSGAPPPSPWPSPPLTMRAWWSLTPGLEKNFHTPPPGASDVVLLCWTASSPT